MRAAPSPICRHADVVIAGAGVTGLYLAYRIAGERPELSIVVLEASERIGGRLRSLKRGDDHVLECGAEFISDAQAGVFALARALKCPLIETKFRRGGAYLRGRRDDEGYALAPHEEKKSASGLVLASVGSVAPEIAALLQESSNRADDFERLREAVIDGRPLWAWSIGALLRRTLSDEGFALARATHGSTSAFGESNAFDALVTQAIEAAPRQRFFRFEHGFESLASALAEASPGVQLGLGHRVVSVRQQPGGLRVRSATANGASEVSARYIFLALPQAALRRVRFSRDLARSWCATDLNAVSPVKAFKLFLEFERQWWNGEVGRLEPGEVAATFTDLPLQQIYFAGGQGERSTVMAAFADGHSAEYWESFRVEPRNCDLVAGAPHAMIEAAMRELRRIYPFAPDAIGGVFADWALGGWHAWKPGVKSWESATRIQQPNSDAPLFICGEAFSQLQGWTEGALNNAEATLERALGLDRPHWLGVEVPFKTKGDKNARLGFSGSPR